jgi:hypothetical protein
MYRARCLDENNISRRMLLTLTTLVASTGLGCWAPETCDRSDGPLQELPLTSIWVIRNLMAAPGRSSSTIKPHSRQPATLPFRSSPAHGSGVSTGVQGWSTVLKRHAETRQVQTMAEGSSGCQT